MPKLLLNLRYVPDDEAEEVRVMLEAHQVEFYETPRGPFGITAGGIWIRSVDDYPRAQSLMDDYQAERRERVRQQLETYGRPSLGDNLRERPLRALAIAAGIAFVLLFFFAPLVVLFELD